MGLLMYQPFKTGNYYFTQKMIALTELFGREYYWMEDTDGTLWLAQVDENGNPDLTRG